MEKLHSTVVVIGAGPGGYASAFRAADLGLQVLLVDENPSLGGVCLNRGCIPSKALLHAVKVKQEAEGAKAFGLTFPAGTWDVAALRAHKDAIVSKLTAGVTQMAKARSVRTLEGRAKLTAAGRITVSGKSSDIEVTFEHCILATGSRPAQIPNLPYDDPRLMDSTDALNLPDIPQRLLVIGGGYIGLEMSTVYAGLGSKVTVVEFLPTLLAAADADLVRPLQRRLKKSLENLYLDTKVAGVKAGKKALTVTFEGKKTGEEDFDRILVSVGRKPNTESLGLETLGVKVGQDGFVVVDEGLRTSVPGIYAIGDLVGQPMLAHKATHEGKVAAEIIAGNKVAFEPAAIPAVVFTDPEIAWVGLTEAEAAKTGQAFEKAVFPWGASGRAMTLDATNGLSKILVDPESGRILGAGICGTGAGDLISEAALALEMGADAEDMALTIHPHPTLSETLGGAAELYHGSVTDLLPKKK